MLWLLFRVRSDCIASSMMEGCLMNPSTVSLGFYFFLKFSDILLTGFFSLDLYGS